MERVKLPWQHGLHHAELVPIGISHDDPGPAGPLPTDACRAKRLEPSDLLVTCAALGRANVEVDSILVELARFGSRQSKTMSPIRTVTSNIVACFADALPSDSPRSFMTRGQ